MLQRELSQNVHILVPRVMSLNDWIKALVEVEEFIRSDRGGHSMEDPCAVIEEWLNGRDIPTPREKVM